MTLNNHRHNIVQAFQCELLRNFQSIIVQLTSLLEPRVRNSFLYCEIDSMLFKVMSQFPNEKAWEQKWVHSKFDYIALSKVSIGNIRQVLLMKWGLLCEFTKLLFRVPHKQKTFIRIIIYWKLSTQLMFYILSKNTAEESTFKCFHA